MTHNTREVEERFRNKILDVETAIRLTYNEKDSDQMVQKMLDFIHQELQKARHDWLREEIVKLEGMKVCPSSEEHERRRDHSTKSGYETALDDAITALQELIK